MAQNETLPALVKEDFDIKLGVSPSLTDLMALAKVMVGSGYWKDINTAAKAVAVMVIGRDLGLSPTQAMNGLHIVQGKPMLHYSVLLAKVRQHPDYDYEIIEQTAKKAEIRWYRKGKAIGSTVFTAEDASRQGTQNMQKFPDTMLIARCASNGVKRFCPDVTNGVPVYVEGELTPDEAPEGTKTERLSAEMKARLAKPEVVTAEVVEEGPDGDLGL